MRNGLTESDGNKLWYLNGELHRTDGPAVEYSSGSKHWYLNGIKYTETEFNNFLLIENFKLIL